MSRRSGYDWLVVGAGLTGATLAENIARELGQRVLVVDRRSHIGGNVYDEVDLATGVRVHRYGPHIFHTSSERVWSYLGRFTDWLPYRHRVLGKINGQHVPIPCNLTTVRRLLPERQAARIEGVLLEEMGYGARVPVLTLLEHDRTELRAFGQWAYETFFLHYTVKQWGLKPEEIDRSVTGRVPVVVSEYDRYFRDRYEGIPAEGYTAMVARMLEHPLIDVELGVEGADVVESVGWKRMVWTGPIDAFFGEAHGTLPYRSLHFEHDLVDDPPFQPVAQVNHPGSDVAYTRTVEHAHFTGFRPQRSVVTRELPMPFTSGENEPYYPVLCPESHDLFRRYTAEAAQVAGHVVFSGRLADFKYYDMDQAVSHALHAFANEVAVRATSGLAAAGPPAARFAVPAMVRTRAVVTKETPVMGSKADIIGQDPAAEREKKGGATWVRAVNRPPTAPGNTSRYPGVG